MVASAGRPPRDSRIEEAVANILAARAALPENRGYAADGDPPRPVPNHSLAGWKRYVEFLWRNSRRNGFQAIPSALYFAFYNDNVSGERGAAISLPRAHLWWLAAPGDSVLLSDGVVQRYTMVSSVDRDARRIVFLDPWEDRFFLKDGLNMEGVAAVAVEGSPGLSVTAEEFERVAVGLQTIDTPALLERYFDAFPERRGNARLLLEFGLALLDAEREDLAPHAAAYLDQALFAALLAPPPEREAIAAALYLALTVSLHKARGSSEPLAAKPFADRLFRLLLDYTEPVLQQRLGIEQLCRMATAAGWAQDFDRAAQLFDLALARQPDHVQARQLRAAASFHKRDFAPAIEDALIALAAGAREMATLQRDRDALDPRGALPIRMAEEKIAGCRRVRSEIYAVLTASCAGAARWEEAERHAACWRTLQPDESAPLVLLARAREVAGDRAAAGRLYLEAGRVETNRDRREAYWNLANELARPESNA